METIQNSMVAVVAGTKFYYYFQGILQKIGTKFYYYFQGILQKIGTNGFKGR